LKLRNRAAPAGISYLIFQWNTYAGRQLFTKKATWALVIYEALSNNY